MKTPAHRPAALFATAAASHEAAVAVARRLGLQLVAERPAGLHLVLDGDGLGLDDAAGGAPIRADLAAAAARRGGRNSPLSRAIGLDRGVRRVVDATAGLGRDAAALAAAGATVTMLERDPLLAALLDAGLARAAAAAPDFAARLELIATDAAAWLARGDHGDPAPEAVLIDPMFPDRGKPALPRRDLQLCRALLGPGNADETARLLAIARRVAVRRVVVKRPPHAAPVAPGAVATVAGPRVRFDLYAPDP